MSDRMTIYLLATNHDGSPGAAGETSAGSTHVRGESLSDRRHSGLVLQTMRDAWIYCKASKKMAAGNQMLPWLSAAAVVISAGTGVTIFATLQQSPATWAKATVGAVTLLMAIITALQTWAASRIKTLNDQARKFHEFHRSVIADLEKNKDLEDPEYAKKAEDALQQIVVGISEPSLRAWANAEQRVDLEMQLLFPELLAHGAVPPKQRKTRRRGSID